MTGLNISGPLSTPGRRPVLAIVGATGAVGTVMRDVVSSRADLWGEVRLIASARSAGRMLPVRGEQVAVRWRGPGNVRCAR